MKTGRTVIITGAAGGMGAEFVRRFLGNGDMVVATDTSDDALEALSSKADSPLLRVRSADITDEGATDALAAFAAEQSGRIDILVNVAGFFPIQPFLEMTAGDWRKIIDVNLTDTALMCKAALPRMVGRGWGRIVNIGSASIYSGVKSQAHYVAAKAGTIGLSRSLAREFGPDGITVNVVAPGVTITARRRRHFRGKFRRLLSRCGA
jgi:NAD(P)-dependent dehydrogenase (short-subunit alcohol dehydrogenase family)